jgi:hypothetical protein
MHYDFIAIPDSEGPQAVEGSDYSKSALDFGRYLHIQLCQASKLLGDEGIALLDKAAKKLREAKAEG